jgi:hypothetical protein
LSQTCLNQTGRRVMSIGGPSWCVSVHVILCACLLA